MSTDGTQPPSITPKKAPAARTGTRPRTTTQGAGARPVTAPLSGDSAPSIGERIKRTAQGVADATRSGRRHAVFDRRGRPAAPRGVGNALRGPLDPLTDRGCTVPAERSRHRPGAGALRRGPGTSAGAGCRCLLGGNRGRLGPVGAHQSP